MFVAALFVAKVSWKWSWCPLLGKQRAKILGKPSMESGAMG